MLTHFVRKAAPILVAAVAALSCGAALAASSPEAASRFDRMSPMGKRAAQEVARLLQTDAALPNAATPSSNAATPSPTAPSPDRDGTCINQPSCPGGLREQAPGGQAELSIAVDRTGKHIVIGFNDTRGFARNPVSVSGYMYSEDRGETFVDGGQLPSPGNQSIGTTLLPQVFGDPEVKYLGGCTFIYSSILVFKFSDLPAPGRAVQSMGVHRSTDCGKTWQGPFEVTAASNPNGQVSASGNPFDAADKEFMDVDPDTGRVIMSWSNFTPFALGGVEIRTTYSDNIKTDSPPTWSAGAIVSALEEDGQSSVPRFARGSNNAYVAWRRFPFPGTFFGFGNTTGFARSTDNGATWTETFSTSDEFFTMDQVLGNDRVNTSPSLAVDNSHGPYKGSIYLVYANNNSGDGADIVLQKSTDQGQTFSEPLELNAAPGDDRAQWFPWVTVDRHTGRVHVFYYDQGIDDTGDLTEVSYLYSDDGGNHWSAPVPLSRRPFNAGWGNDTGQPNLGDYNQAVSQRGKLYAAFAVTAPPPLGFVDGQLSTSLTIPDAEFRLVDQHSFADLNTLALSVNVNQVSFSDSGGNGNIDPGEIITLQLPLENYTTNDLSDGAARAVAALLSSDTPGVQIIRPLAFYGRIKPGTTGESLLAFRLRTTSSFAPGTRIDLKLVATGLFGPHFFSAAKLHHSLFTGTPQPTLLFAENFDGVVPGSLPSGWTTAHGGGANTVPWTSSNTFCGSSNAAFHTNAEDGPALFQATRFERLFSPLVTVPADSDYVTLEFDICTDTEEDPNFNVLAYDGFLVRVTDFTTGNTLRSVLLEAIADEFTTGDIKHFPKHLPRSGNPAYFQDMSVWAGDSGGPQHVSLRLPGMAGTTVQLRFEFTQDGIATCADLRPGHTCGVSVDNILMNSVQDVAPAPAH